MTRIFKLGIMTALLLLPIILFAQETVEVNGVGTNRETAIQDALRQAVALVLGTQVMSETAVENFQLLKDAIKTRTEGYILSSEVIEETPFPDRHEVRLRATVSLSPLEMDAKSLAQWLGGLRFMTVYDPRKLKTKDDTVLYDYAYERMNEYLARQGYRYVERSVFDRLKNEAVKIIGADTSTMDFAKKLAFLADAEFFISIHNLIMREEEKAMGIKAIRATADTKSYDNCTAEGLGTVVGEGDWQVSTDRLEAQRKAIDGAIFNAGEKNFYLILKYLGEWCNNGAPFESRFYGIDEDMMDGLVDRLIEDPDYGGQLEPVMAGDYWRLNTTFKETAYRMRRKTRDYANSLGMPLETKLQYGRQLSFGPKNVKVPEAEEKANVEVILEPIRK